MDNKTDDVFRTTIINSMAAGRIYHSLPDGYLHAREPHRFPLLYRCSFTCSVLSKLDPTLPEAFYVSTGISHFYITDSM